jgi:hypothetical protein
VETRQLLQRFRQFLADEERFWRALVLRLQRAYQVALEPALLTPGGGGGEEEGGGGGPAERMNHWGFPALPAEGDADDDEQEGGKEEEEVEEEESPPSSAPSHTPSSPRRSCASATLRATASSTAARRHTGTKSPAEGREDWGRGVPTLWQWQGTTRARARSIGRHMRSRRGRGMRRIS